MSKAGGDMAWIHEFHAPSKRVEARAPRYMKLLVPVTPVEGPNGWEVRRNEPRSVKDHANPSIVELL